MKRKSLQDVTAVGDIAVFDGGGPKVDFRPKDNEYNCLNCGKLPASRFSKSKINQYDRQKITTITCTCCTSKAVLVDENEKSSAKKARIDEMKTECLNQEQILSARKADPSAMYDSNPLDAPTVHDAINYFNGKSVPFKVHIGKLKGWRTVAKLAVRGELVNSRDGVNKVFTSIGLFQPGSHKVIKCVESEAHHPSINYCVRFVDETCKQLGIHGYIEGSGSDVAECFLNKSYLKYIIMAVERVTSKVQMTLVWNTSPSGNEDGDAHLKQLIDAMSVRIFPSNKDNLEGLLLHSIWVNYNPSSRYSNAITCHDNDSWCLMFGKPHIKEQIATDMIKPPKLRFPPLVFRQANIDAFSNIIRNIRSWIKSFEITHSLRDDREITKDSEDLKSNLKSLENSTDDIAVEVNETTPKINCVELYAGVGTIGLNCLDLFQSLHCSDENPHNKSCFDATLAKMSRRVRSRAVYESKGATAIARAGGLKGYDIVVVDPPRKGLDDEVVDAMLAYCPTEGVRSDGPIGSKNKCNNNLRLIYVSCGFKAFKRDMARLTGGESSLADYAYRKDGGTDINSYNASAAAPKLKMSTGIVDEDCDSGRENHSNRGKEIRYWKIIHAEGHVLFPGSDHIETFAVLDRVL